MTGWRPLWHLNAAGSIKPEGGEPGKHKMTSQSEKSGSSQDGTQDSWRELSGVGDREATVLTDRPRLSTQRSLTADTMEMSEDSFAMGDTSG